VNDIRVKPQDIDSQTIQDVIITYRFDEPCQIITLPPSAVVIDHTPERAGFDYGRLEIAGKWGER
jgi:hypothetical protein